jgi:hypothetical protein
VLNQQNLSWLTEAADFFEPASTRKASSTEECVNLGVNRVNRVNLGFLGFALPDAGGPNYPRSRPTTRGTQALGESQEVALRTPVRWKGLQC